MRRYVEQLRDGDALDEVFLATEKQLKTNKHGNPFLQVDLRDRSGGITGRMWNAGDHVFRAFENGDFVHVDGKVQLYNGVLQVIVNRVEKAEPKAVELGDFLPHTDQDVGQLTDR